MADNVTYPGDPAATKTVWTDEVAGSKHAQYVKLVDGTADSVAIIPGDATNGLYVNVKSLTGGNPVPIEFADSWIVDAFGRQRVSLPNKILELKHIHDARTLQTSSVQISGSGTSATYRSNESCVRLSVGNTTAGVRVHQTKQRAPYSAGQSHLFYITYNQTATTGTGITKRIGLFDDRDGVYLRWTSAGPAIVLRTYFTGSAQETVKVQADWNLDKLDGSGAGSGNPSGLTLSAVNSNIFLGDLEYLGEGTVRVGFVINRIPYYVHEFNNANVNTGVYMSNPNLPLRWEITNDGSGAAASLDAVCGAVFSEGGSNDQIGITYGIDRGSTSLATNNDSNIYPLLAYRVNSSYRGAAVKVRGFKTLCTSTSDYRWLIVLNPTVSGTALSFSANTNTAIDLATPTNATTLTAGTGLVLASGYQQAGNSASTQIAAVASDLWPGIGADGSQDVVCLAVQRLSGTTETFYGGFTLLETI